jgi:predicted transposase/invertase (TIGR01784 family)
MLEIDAWYEQHIAEAEQKAEQRAKRENQQEIAANLMERNISLEIISEATGLSLEQLEQLRSRSLGSGESN